ncbi:hypothetical protein FISHEDRAFT_55094 [Fistulina hepatica ATCC 64428]|uniref:Uncharacterized protein n=1 Tax=Fistulina hepatica ATCC 64428 TaxID=1128425 RepID=A0A0D7APQ0_9AGAR|nr:hypothetical protein FISHEDRAFT_55094 [Fistulina hepatica ATCC 64428]
MRGPMLCDVAKICSRHKESSTVLETKPATSVCPLKSTKAEWGEPQEQSCAAPSTSDPPEKTIISAIPDEPPPMQSNTEVDPEPKSSQIKHAEADEKELRKILDYELERDKKKLEKRERIGPDYDTENLDPMRFLESAEAAFVQPAYDTLKVVNESPDINLNSVFPVKARCPLYKSSCDGSVFLLPREGLRHILAVHPVFRFRDKQMVFRLQPRSHPLQAGDKREIIHRDSQNRWRYLGCYRIAWALDLTLSDFPADLRQSLSVRTDRRSIVFKYGEKQELVSALAVADCASTMVPIACHKYSSHNVAFVHLLSSTSINRTNLFTIEGIEELLDRRYACRLDSPENKRLVRDHWRLGNRYSLTSSGVFSKAPSASCSLADSGRGINRP